jgi:hypothetical protein
MLFALAWVYPDMAPAAAPVRPSGTMHVRMLPGVPLVLPGQGVLLLASTDPDPALLGAHRSCGGEVVGVVAADTRFTALQALDGFYAPLPADVSLILRLQLFHRVVVDLTVLLILDAALANLTAIECTDPADRARVEMAIIGTTLYAVVTVDWHAGNCTVWGLLERSIGVEHFGAEVPPIADAVAARCAAIPANALGIATLAASCLSTCAGVAGLVLRLIARRRRRPPARAAMTESIGLN